MPEKSIYEVIAELGGTQPGQVLESQGQQYFAPSAGPIAAQPFALNGGTISEAQQFAYPQAPVTDLGQVGGPGFVDGPVSPGYVHSRVAARDMFGMPRMQVEEIPAGPVVAQMIGNQGLDPQTQQQLLAMSGGGGEGATQAPTKEAAARTDPLQVAVGLAQKLQANYQPDSSGAIPIGQIPPAWTQLMGIEGQGGWSADFIDKLSDEEAAMLQMLIHKHQKTGRQEALEREGAQ